MPPHPPSDGIAPPSDRALVSKLHVVDGASLRFVETGEAREDTYDIEWEATPAPAERAENPFEAQVQRMFSEEARPEPDPEPEPPPDLRPPRGQGRPRLGQDGSLESMPAVFEGMDPRALQASLEHFDVLDVFAGETLIGQGERHPALVMPLRGTLEAVRGGHARRRVASGEVLGQTTLFGSGVWPVTLRTLSECRLLVLELEGYQALRSTGNRLSLAIEEHTIGRFLDGLERTAAELSERLEGRPLEELLPSKGFLARFAAAFGAGGIQPARVDVVQALLASPLFRNAEEQHLAGLRGRMEGIRAGAGEFLITQGEPSTHLYVLVSGSVDVISAAGPNRAVRHETLGPGDLFGGWSMVRERGGWASYVVMERSVLLEMDKVAWAELATARDSTGSVLRLALLRSLARRLVDVRTQLVALQSGGAPAAQTIEAGDDRFVTINPASRR